MKICYILHVGVLLYNAVLYNALFNIYLIIWWNFVTFSHVIILYNVMLLHSVLLQALTTPGCVNTLCCINPTLIKDPGWETRPVPSPVLPVLGALRRGQDDPLRGVQEQQWQRHFRCAVRLGPQTPGGVPMWGTELPRPLGGTRVGTGVGIQAPAVCRAGDWFWWS